jgi:DNA mismatch repair ATPase MutS
MNAETAFWLMTSGTDMPQEEESMYESILYLHNSDRERAAANEQVPDIFNDLNLDQVIDRILHFRHCSSLAGCFYTALKDIDAIVYRQETMKDLEDKQILSLYKTFSDTLIETNERCVKIRNDNHDAYGYVTCGKLFHEAEQYCREIEIFSDEVNSITVHSKGLMEFAAYLETYIQTDSFKKLSSETERIRYELNQVKYCMLIRNGTVKVRKYEGQKNHSERIVSLFERFSRGSTKNYKKQFEEKPHAEHIEEAVMELVAGLYPDAFNDLKQFCNEHDSFADKKLLRTAKELPFYFAWLTVTKPMKQDGLSFCYPKMCMDKEKIYDYGDFDIALAQKLGNKIITNDFELNAPEKMIIITGPNQGGKTTFARAYGQIHYLASIGLSVPGTSACLHLPDMILTHFGKEEDTSGENGRLQDDLLRMHSILNKATENSLIIVNEIYSTATLQDAMTLSNYMMDAFSEKQCTAVVVTFLEELAHHGKDTIGMTSVVKEDDPAQRTYKVVRREADGLAYAEVLAGRHGLTYDQLNRRLHR